MGALGSGHLGKVWSHCLNRDGGCLGQQCLQRLVGETAGPSQGDWMVQSRPSHPTADVVCGGDMVHGLAVPIFCRRGREASGGRVSFCAPEGIVQWDSECATAEREIAHQAVTAITVFRKMG